MIQINSFDRYTINHIYDEHFMLNITLKNYLCDVKYAIIFNDEIHNLISQYRTVTSDTNVTIRNIPFQNWLKMLPW